MNTLKNNTNKKVAHDIFFMKSITKGFDEQEENNKTLKTLKATNNTGTSYQPILMDLSHYLNRFVPREDGPRLAVGFGCQQGDGPGGHRWWGGESVCRLCGVRLPLRTLR